VAKPGVKLEDLEATFWSELAKLQADGPTADEVEAAKAGTLTEKIAGLQRLGGFGGVADTLDQYNQYTGDPGYLPKDIAGVEAVSVASAKAAAVKYLSKDSAVVVYCVPGRKVLEDVPRSPEDTDAQVKITNPYTPEFEAAQAWRKEVPKAGPPVTVHLPVPETFTLGNGLKVYVVPEHSLPVLSASFVTRAGNENNAAGKEGLASLTALTMGEATTTRDLKTLADAQERIGVRIGVASTMDGASSGLTVLTNHTHAAFDLFSDVLLHPAFKEEDLDRLRKQRLIGIQQEMDNVVAMIGRVGPKLLYGEQPYGASGTGTTESVTGLRREDVTGFYAGHYGPADSALVLVGDVTTGEAKKLAEEYFGKWTGNASAAITLPPAPTPPVTHVVIVDKPGAPQTALEAFGLGVPANSPDLQTLQVMNYVLGGSFASRINMNLREVHGYTYGANSAYQTYRGGGQFVAGGLVKTDVTGPAATQLMYEIKRFPGTPPTEAELNEAKVARVQSLPGQFETSGAVAGSMTSIFLYDRPLDYYATLPAKYQAVTAADVERVATEDVHPEQLIIVAAGDRGKIEPQLKAADLGVIEVRDINGKMVEQK
jgi:zinc protease